RIDAADGPHRRGTSGRPALLPVGHGETWPRWRGGPCWEWHWWRCQLVLECAWCPRPRRDGIRVRQAWAANIRAARVNATASSAPFAGPLVQPGNTEDLAAQPAGSTRRRPAQPLASIRASSGDLD